MKFSIALIPFLVGIAPWTTNAARTKLSKNSKSKQGPPPPPNPVPPIPPPNPDPPIPPPNPDPPIPPDTIEYTKPKDSLVEIKITHTLNECATKSDCKFVNNDTECIAGVCIWEETRYSRHEQIFYPSTPNWNIEEKKSNGRRFLAASDEYEKSSFSVTAVGTGQISGLSFTVPARSETRIVANLRITAMSSETVNNLRNGWMGLLEASKREEVLKQEQLDTTLSANLSFLGIFSGGAKSETTYSQSNSKMTSMGLTEQQIDVAMEMFANATAEMSTVLYDSTVFNRDNPRSVNGRLQFFTMGGDVRTSDNRESFEYMALSDGAVAGQDGSKAEAQGEFVFS